ncbi:MAG: hypothetical protein JETT_2937 [Candidatus Jettenia ecosi]|uniref:Uncharacterized protein n=1 Tax=Candidatus Jettenia ecosi TaxID=2494326 RepID=A0A533Q811_9BACT|nr:MAG: hypothetical protein JETT_2937 [Candidatus Jettenia ecosi]
MIIAIAEMQNFASLNPEGVIGESGIFGFILGYYSREKSIFGTFWIAPELPVFI